MTVEVQEIFSAMRAESRRVQMPSWTERANRLRRLRALVVDHERALCEAINGDFGHRAHQETRIAEIFPSIQAINHALKHGAKWMKPSKRSTGTWFKPASSWILPQPLGVVGIMVPWNYPLNLAVAPMVSALAAGNRVMLKQSELTPRFAALFKALIERIFNADEIAVINGDAMVARGFSSLPFDHLLFTGSTAVGQQVMLAASENLSPVTLELGGKSPAIIGPGADFEKSVERIVFGKALNAGQTCVAPDYVMVPAHQEQRFAESAQRAFDKLYPDLHCNSDYTSIITTRHFSRLEELLADAVNGGASETRLSKTLPNPQTRRFPLTLLTGVNSGMSVMKEEIFGPLLPVLGYDDISDAIEYVNARPRPLALYLFERDRHTVDQVMHGTVSGGVSINDTLLHVAQDDLPFGGVGGSGMGAYHGEFGFRNFSQMKPVFRQSRIGGAWLLRPPYGKRFEKMMRFMVR